MTGRCAQSPPPCLFLSNRIELPREFPIELPIALPIELPIALAIALPTALPIELPVALPVALPIALPSGLPIELPIELSIESLSCLPIELSFESLIELLIQLLMESECLENAFWISWDPVGRTLDASGLPFRARDAQGRHFDEFLKLIDFQRKGVLRRPPPGPYFAVS